MTTETYGTIIVGGGVVGASCAYHLREAGRDVLLLEKDQPASKASGRAAGHLRTYSSGKFDRRIAAYSVDFFEELAGEHSQITLYEDTDIVLAHSSEGVTELKRTASESTTPLTFMTPEELRAELPALDAASIKGGLKFEDAVHTDPYLLTRTLIDEAAASGAEIRLEGVTTCCKSNGEVTVETNSNRYRANNLVCAAGAWSARFLEQIGVEVPLQPRTSQVVILETPNSTSLPMFHAPDLHLYGREEPNGDVLVGGGSTTPIEDPDTFVTEASESFIQHVADSAQEISTMLEDARMVNNWAGRCTATPDRNPLIGETSVSNVYVCAGFNGGGVARAPFAGRLLTDLLCGLKSEFDPEPFRPMRFDGSEEFEIKSATTNW